MTIRYEHVTKEECFTNQDAFQTESNNTDLSSEKEETKEQPSEDKQVTTSSIKKEPKRRREYPDLFYCPITKSLLKDAVVLPDGDTFERSAIEERGDVAYNKMYVNRAIIAIMEEETANRIKSLRSSLRWMGRSLRQNLDQFLDDSLESSSSESSSAITTMALPSRRSLLAEYRPLPDSYYCPITFNLMHVPVIDADGNTFERAAVVKWILSNGGTSPITRNSVNVEDLYPNNALKGLMDIEKGRSEAFMHRSIRRWKEESPPEFDVSSKSAAAAAAISNDLEAQWSDDDTINSGSFDAAFDEGELHDLIKSFFYFVIYFANFVMLIAFLYFLYNKEYAF